MACKLSTQCDLVYGFLKCALLEDTIDVDLEVCTWKGIHTFRKDYKSQTTKCSPWGTKVQPYPSWKKKIVGFMYHWQAITTPFANRPYQPKPNITMKKRNLVPVTRPNRSKLSWLRKVNMRKLPKATISRSLTQEAKDVAQHVSTSLAPIQGSQLMDTTCTPSHTSPAAPAKITKNSQYCVISTLLGKICPEEFSMSSDWDEEDDQAKAKDQKQPQTNPSSFTTMTWTLQPPMSYVTKYFDSMTNKTPKVYTPKEKWRCDTIVAQQELNTTEPEALDQDSLEDISWTEW